MTVSRLLADAAGDLQNLARSHVAAEQTLRGTLAERSE
jgi:hypothetical protein